MAGAAALAAAALAFEAGILAAGVAAGTGPVPGVINAAPHFRQKRLSGGLSKPQIVQFIASPWQMSMFRKLLATVPVLHPQSVAPPCVTAAHPCLRGTMAD
jgi:hypothetical protein